MAKQQIAVDGLTALGLWVRRRRSSPSVTEEALSLAHVLDMWNLSAAMSVDHFDVWDAEVSGPDLQPTWVYLVALTGRRRERPARAPHAPVAVPGDQSRMIASVHSASCANCAIGMRSRVE